MVCFFSFSTSIYASYAVIEPHAGRIFYGANPYERMPIASLTKMWTALVVIENADLHERVVVSKKATYSEGSSVYLKEGETYTVEELLYGLMLRSGNDAAMALAEHVGGSEEGFVYLMNERAKIAQLQNTTFMNPSGLHHPLHLSNAYDTAKMLAVAMENEMFRKIASTSYYNSSFGLLENKHKLVRQDAKAIAGKTGYTKVAGRTLATYYEKNGKAFVIVTLNESNDWLFHHHLAELVDREYKWKTLVKKGTYKTATHTIKVNDDMRYLIRKDEEKEMKHLLLLSSPSIRPIGIWQVRAGSQIIDTFQVEVQKR